VDRLWQEPLYVGVSAIVTTGDPEEPIILSHTVIEQKSLLAYEQTCVKSVLHDQEYIYIIRALAWQ
jgi:hypothetical protein